MEITEIRRERLKLWFADKTVPKKEKSYLSQLMGKGKSKSASFGEKAARRLERTYGMGEYYLDQPFSGEATIIRWTESNLDAPQEMPSRTTVGIVGTIQGGDDGYLAVDQSEAEGSVMHASRDSKCYAMRVRGDSMSPRIRHGEFIVLEPGREAQPGDDVAVCLNDGRRLVKEFMYTRDGEITLGSINNGHGNITVLLSEIESIHPVAAILPRAAFKP